MAAKAKKKRTASKKTRARKIQKLAKGKPAPLEEHGLDVRDALKVYDAAKRHRAVLKKLGLKEDELKALDDQIKLAKVWERQGGRLSLDDARTAVKNVAGPYRRAARLASNGLKGRDSKLLAALRADGAFPPNDKLLDAWLTDIDQAMKPHAAKLAERDFPAGKQTELVTAAKAFHGALEGRPELKSEAEQKSDERDQVFETLRTMTSYVREVGRTALIDSPKRSDFDREKPAKKKKPASKPKPGP